MLEKKEILPVSVPFLASSASIDFWAIPVEMSGISALVTSHISVVETSSRTPSSGPRVSYPNSTAIYFTKKTKQSKYPKRN